MEFFLRMLTIKDVAREAGVSYSTVSVVLGNRTTKLPIAEKTRAKVLECAARIGYRRNALASQMLTGKTNIIAMLSEMVRYEFTFRAIAAASTEAELNGYYVKLVNLQEFSGNTTERHRLFDLLLEQRPAGIIIKNYISDQEYLIQAAKECKIPVALLDDALETADALIVSNDEEGISRAVSYLADFGHRRIGFFSDHLEKGKFSQIRFTAFQNAMQKLALEQNPAWNCSLDYYHNRKIREFLADLFSGSEPKPTAFCCASDLIALRVLTGLQRLGIRVPEDVSLIGYGGIHFTELTDPSLTTVFQNFEEMGRCGVKYIMDFLNNKTQEHLHQVIPTRILEGESVAPPNRGDRQ